MNIFQLSIISSLVASLVIGCAVFATQVRRTANQAFLGLSLLLAVYMMCFGFGASAQDASWLEFWIRQTSAVSALVPAAMNLLRLAVVNQSDSGIQLLRRARPWLLAYLPVALLCQTKFFLHGARLPVGGETVGVPVYGAGFALFAAYFLLALGTLVARFYRDLSSVKGIQRMELQFILLGCCGGLLFGIVFLLLPYLVGSLEIGMFLPLCVVVLDGVIAYGIATRRIMDVPDFLRRVTAYAFLVGYLLIVYGSVLYGARWLLRTILQTTLPLDQLLATLAVAFSIAPANGRMQRVANRLFLNINLLDVNEALKRAGRVLSSIATLGELLDHLSRILAEAVGTDRVLILLAEDGRFQQAHPRTTGDGIALGRSDPLATALGEQQEPLVLDVINRIRPSPTLIEAGQQMRRLGTAVATGIRSKTGLEGILLLGPRLSGRIYGSAEQRLLETLSDQLAVAIENSRLYTQVQNSRIYNDILLDNLVSGVIAANQQRTVTVFNREAQRIARREAQEVVDKPIDALPEPFADIMEAMFQSGQGPRDLEITVHAGGDEPVPIRIGGSLFRSHTGGVLGALLVFNDLTAIRKLEGQVRRTDRLASLGTLSAGMAHEIKNPLVTLKTFTQLLPERYEDTEFRETFTTLVAHEVRRIDSIVNQLLRFARPAKPTLLPMHLHQAVENTLRLVHEQMRQKQITLVRHLEAPFDLIRGDSDLLVQAFVNILFNALDAMTSGGTLTVSTAIVEQEVPQRDLWGSPPTESYLRLSVRDTGGGIASEDLPHVFDPFFTTKSSGTGLGLSVSHGIIQEHGGLVDVESVLREGTTFHLMFPLLSREAVT
jgi:signal transduction histidine kinase